MQYDPNLCRIDAKICTICKNYAQCALNMHNMQKICKLEICQKMQFIKGLYFAYICKICTGGFADVASVRVRRRWPGVGIQVAISTTTTILLSSDAAGPTRTRTRRRTLKIKSPVRTQSQEAFRGRHPREISSSSTMTVTHDSSMARPELRGPEGPGLGRVRV